MARSPLAGLGLLLLFSAAGCLHHGGPSCAHAPAAAEEQAPLVTRTNLEETLLGQAGRLPGPPAAQGPLPYRVVTARQAQCLAARNADSANLLDRERQSVQEDTPDCCLFHNRQAEGELRQLVLLHTGREVRNTTAGQALEGFYALAGAEVRGELSQALLGEIERALSKTLELREQGLKAPVELDTLRRQEADAHRDEVENRLNVEKLNLQLRQALGMDGSCEDWRIWPDTEAEASPEVCLDEQQAVAVGMAQRPKLVMLREVIPRVNRRTVEEARMALASVSPLLGTSTPRPSPLFTLLARPLMIGREEQAAQLLRAQLRDYLRDQEGAVAVEIRQAIAEIRARRETARIARDRLDRVKERLAELRQLQAQGLAGYAEQLAGNAEAIKARGELIRELLLARTAEVRLRQAQGLLVQECENCPSGGN